MSNLIPFDFNNHQVRVINSDPNNPLFVAIDIAKALGYKKPRNAIQRFCKKQSTAPKQGGGFMVLINETDMYRLIFGSKLEAAQKFQDWVFNEVLPSIRKTGQYVAPEPTGLTKLQKGHIHQTVMSIASNGFFSHSSLFGQLKRHFGVSKYDEINATDYGRACQLLGVSPRKSLLVAKKEPIEALPVLSINERKLRSDIHDLSQQLNVVNNLFNKVVKEVFVSPNKRAVH